MVSEFDTVLKASFNGYEKLFVFESNYFILLNLSSPS